MSLFIDSSVWLAAVNKRDEHCQRAKVILSAGEYLITSDHVLVETWTLIRNRIHRRAADSFWESLRDGVALIECVGLADLEAAWAIGETYPDQDFSFVDRTSFAVMRRLGIERAASFDHDFSVFRYGPDRRRAFTVLC